MSIDALPKDVGQREAVVMGAGCSAYSHVGLMAQDMHQCPDNVAYCWFIDLEPSHNVPALLEPWVSSPTVA